jgi:putative tricarboxylic transport membrane protein
MAERLVALALLVVGGVYLASALPLPLGTMARPGPGFFPIAVGVFALVVGAVWVAIAMRRVPAAAGPAFASASSRGRLLSTAGVLVGFCLLLPWVGYPVAAFLFVAVLLRVLGAGWFTSVGTAVASAAVSYYLFARLLGVPLPPGVLLD